MQCRYLTTQNAVDLAPLIIFDTDLGLGSYEDVTNTREVGSRVPFSFTLRFRDGGFEHPLVLVVLNQSNGMYMIDREHNLAFI